MADLQTIKQKQTRQIQNMETDIDTEKQKCESVQYNLKCFEDSNRQVSHTIRYVYYIHWFISLMLMSDQ